MYKYFKQIFVSVFLFLLILNVTAQDQKALTFEDIMKFKSIKSSAISDDGAWVLYNVAPDRGDPATEVISANGKVSYHVPLADKAVFSKDGNWVAMQQLVPLEESLRAKMKDEKKVLKPGLVLLAIESGAKISYESVKAFSFSNDNKWLIYHRYGKKEKAKTGTELVLKSLENDEVVTFDFVTKYVMDSAANFLAYEVSDTSKENNGLYVCNLSEPGQRQSVLCDSLLWVDQLTWNKRSGMLAFVSGIKNEDGERVDAKVYGYTEAMSSSIEGAEDEKFSVLLEDADLDEGWKVYHTNKLRWSKDGERLFLGTRPSCSKDSEEKPSFAEASEEKPTFAEASEENDTIVNLYDFEEILGKREVDVWHWNDPYINSQQKKMWKKRKDKTFAGVYYVGEDRFVQLADEDMPDVRISDVESYVLGSSNVPYARRMTWDGSYNDFYVVNIKSGKRFRIIQEQEGDVRMSPDGKYVVFYRGGEWYLASSETGEIGCLTCALNAPFYDEDWDYPADVPGYRGINWIGKSDAVMIYDKYDIWMFPCTGGEPVCLSEGKGRKEKLQFRVKNLDREKRYFDQGDEVYLSAYHDLEKYSAVYKMKAGEPGVELLAGGAFRIDLKAKAEDGDVLLFSKESYRVYPDLWVSGSDMKKAKKLSDLGAQTDAFAWGNAELVEWNSADGRELQGILIKPGNYVEGKKYPVLVYYYRFFTPRMYNFPDMAINHRPNYPFYASNDYAIFLPDIRFDVGTPGYSATKCLVPGVQKIIDMGIADPDAIGLHGHSWSGYQTAFVITQTNIFSCAIAGAPVTNMTSAYGGIRWGSGMARQFQYEKSQSRIGGTLWDARDKYIENSPVFFADRIETPLLIEFGDQDDAVPWYQGIEMYLAMRRLDKDCIFLQYRGEPHHLKKYANKLDYTIRFKEYMDHYLKGVEAADWIKDGFMYQGE